MLHPEEILNLFLFRAPEVLKSIIKIKNVPTIIDLSLFFEACVRTV